MRASSTPWPCSTCGAPGVRNLGTQGYCAAHLVDVYRLVRPGIWLEFGGGVGLPDVLRPDCGPGWADLTCVACGAGWLGPIFQRCRWCEDALARLAEAAAAAVLRPPDVQPGDRDYGDRMRAWAARLANAVRAELITEAKARAVWQREVGDGRRHAA